MLQYNVTKAYVNQFGVQTPSDSTYEAANQALEESQPFFQYLDDTQQQVMLGNYADKSTLLGTIVQIGTGIAGVDLPADLRDITYDATHFEASLDYLSRSGLDLLALAPVIGFAKNLKYGDEAAEIFQNVVKRVDRLEEARNAIKNGQKLSNEAKGALRKQARAILEADGQDIAKKPVHHIIPLEWAHRMGKDFNPNELGNIKALDPATHTKVNNEWIRFKKLHPNPTAQQIQAEANRITKKFGL